MKNFWCNIGIHRFYVGSYQTGMRSKFTGDHVGRSERQCMDCNKKMIFMGQFSKKFQELVWLKLNLRNRPEYISYQEGDWLDIQTKSQLAQNLEGTAKYI